MTIEDPAQDFSLAVFPFLKTTVPTCIGPFVFCSTEATASLPPKHASAVTDIASSLFLQDNLRLRSSSYAITPRIEFDEPSEHLEVLRNIQAIVAYLYSSPHPVLGHAFLSSEHASMAIFSPAPVSVFLIRPEYHVEDVGPVNGVKPDHRHEVQGFAGLYNFRHYFWTTRGSRLYGPIPRVVLNHSQDLAADVPRAMASATYQRLIRLLTRPPTDASARFFTSLGWHNDANSANRDDSSAIVSLAIAFETLLGLPLDAKTDRLVDAICLLLGRVPRLDAWARQFYDARSQIVHEGRSARLRFVVMRSAKSGDETLYQSLLSYGRYVFRLCLGTLSAGAEFAETVGLEAKLVTNQERFESVCRQLADETVDPLTRLGRMLSVAKEIEDHRFMGESGLRIETMLSAARAAARVALQCGSTLPPEVRGYLEGLCSADRTTDHVAELDALRAAADAMPDPAAPHEADWEAAMRVIVKTTWSYLALQYIWLKRVEDNT